MKLSLSFFIPLLVQAFQGWKKDNATVWCAALAYFTVFSLGPLLLLVISITGIISSKTNVEEIIYSQTQSLIGSESRQLLQTVVEGSEKPTTSIMSSIIGTIMLIIGATGVFGQLQQMFNTIWGVTQKPKIGFINLVRSRVLNFSMVGVVSFLLLVSLLASTAISSIGTYFGELLPVSPIILEIINFIVSLFITTALFAVTIKMLPDVKLSWNTVGMGALVTALLFTIGKAVIGIYIGSSGIASQYGAAGSLIVLLLWVYYSSQILFFGVEFTKAHYLTKNKRVTPNEFAVLSANLTKRKSK